MNPTVNEAQLLLALQAHKGDPKLTTRGAAKIYNVPRTTLRRRMNNICSRHDTVSNARKLTDLEESTIIQYVLDLDSRTFPPRLCVWKIWLIDCLQTATRHQLDRDGLQTSSSATES